MKKKYLFISNIAAPYQVKFCYKLQKYFDAEFWFYEHIDDVRPEWWKIPLGDKCKILKGSGRFKKFGYFSFGLIIDIIHFKPDIVVLGGFMRWHVFIARIAKLMGAKVAIMSEPVRYVGNDDEESRELVTKENSARIINITKRLFNNVDLFIGMGDIAERQFLEEFGFEREKVVEMYYPTDIAEYYNHPLRNKKVGDPITLLFASRLVERYQPLIALEVLKRLSEQNYNVNMLMNADGSEKEKCIAYIKEHNLTNVKFLDSIDSWNNMHLIYKQSDILLLPAHYSNGNLSTIEAAASGMGLVMSDQINSIYIDHAVDKNCFICEPTVDAFLENVLRYIHNPSLIDTHGAYGREHVKGNRNDYTAENYFETFKKFGFVD